MGEDLLRCRGFSESLRMESAPELRRRRLRTVFKIAKVPQAHAHRFRHTFAVELLKKGVPIEEVSILLGHSSVRITERNYAAWVQARQEILKGHVAIYPATSTASGTSPEFERPLDVKAAARFLGVSPSLVYSYVERKQIPHFRMMGRAIRFRLSELEVWREQFHVIGEPE
jgi:excisionase family DNA binding protein